jgi:hypothetical protein
MATDSRTVAHAKDDSHKSTAYARKYDAAKPPPQSTNRRCSEVNTKTDGKRAKKRNMDSLGVDSSNKRQKTEEEPPRKTACKKDLGTYISKTEQNTAFLTYLRLLDIPMKKLVVLILDTSMLCTTKMLLEAGLLPSHIYIPQPDIMEAKRMTDEYPTLKVFSEMKAGDLIWKLADKGIKFHGVHADYCGTPGDVGRKNMPVDDMTNLIRYSLLMDQAVLTQTVCARSRVAVRVKYESFKYLIRMIKKRSRSDGRRVYKANESIYTDKGSQTMCHYRCILRK